MLNSRIIWVVVLSIKIGVAFSQNTQIKGVVTDSITGDELPYVSLLLDGTTIGTTTNDKGLFSLTTSSPSPVLLISYLGYEEKRVKIIPGRVNNLKIHLVPSSIAGI